MYFFAVLGLAVVYPLVVSTDIPPMTIIPSFCFRAWWASPTISSRANSAICWKRRAKNYIITNLTTMVTILTNVAKIILLLLGADIVVIQASYMVFNLLQMLFIGLYIHRRYKWLNLKVQPNYAPFPKRTMP